MQVVGQKVKSVVRFAIVVVILTLVIMVVCLLMLKYAVEGEDNMPFELSQLIAISTAEGIDKEETENRWNFNLVQNNDVYLYISKNKDYKETEIIKNVTLSNFKIENGPNKGNLKIYKPSKQNEKMYEYGEEYIADGEITYIGTEKGNPKNLEISNQGGIIMLRLCTSDIRKFFIK